MSQDQQLLAAIYSGDTNKVNNSLNYGANPNGPQGMFGEPLRVASMNLRIDIILILIARGAFIRAHNDIALVAAAMARDYILVNYLLQKGANKRRIKSSTDINIQNILARY